MEYYDTYSFAAFIHYAAVNGFPEWNDGFNDFVEQHSNVLFLPFQKFTILHRFIAFAIYNSFLEEVDDVVFANVTSNEDYVLWVNDALNFHQVPHPSFGEWLKSKSLTLDELENKEIIIDYYIFLDKIGALR